jgi:general secretion pathway protein A
MHSHFFQLKGPPFLISPDPRYFFMSPRHRKALDHLISGIRESGGCVLLTGEVGTGKTTLNGQPELNRILQRKNLRQFTQRITCRYHLKSLSAAGLTAAYIYHWISGSGGDASKLFTRAVIRKIRRLSGGIPRLINLLCHRDLHNAYLGNHKRVNLQILRQAASEVHPVLARPCFRKAAYWTAALVALLVAGTAAGYYIYHFGQHRFKAAPAANQLVLPAGNEILKNILAQNTGSNTLGGEATRSTASAAGDEVMASLNAKAPPVVSEAFADQLVFAELIRDPKLTRGEAFARLFSEWNNGSKTGESADLCAWALEKGLRCLFGNCNWHFMRRLNRPVILEFLVKDYEKRYATLVALDEHRLTLDIGPQRLTFPLE